MPELRPDDYIRLFLQRVANMCAPEAMLDADGDVCFDWNIEDNYTVSVSIRQDGRVGWAALIGEYTGHGYFNLPDWPEEFSDMLAKADR